MNISDYITCDSGVCGGDPVFKGTRIPIYLVLYLIEGGISIPEINKRYYPQLSEDAIRAGVSSTLAQRASSNHSVSPR